MLRESKKRLCCTPGYSINPASRAFALQLAQGILRIISARLKTLRVKPKSFKKLALTLKLCEMEDSCQKGSVVNPLPKWYLFLMVPLFLLLRPRFVTFGFVCVRIVPLSFPYCTCYFCSMCFGLIYVFYRFLFSRICFLWFLIYFPYFVFICVYFCLCLVTLVVCTYLIYLFLFVSFLWHLSFTPQVGLCRETKGVSLPLPLCPFGAGAAGATDCNCFVRKNLLQLATCCTHLQLEGIFFKDFFLFRIFLFFSLDWSSFPCYFLLFGAKICVLHAFWS